MRTSFTIGLALTAALASAVFGQAAGAAMQDRTFTFQHAATAPEFQEIANVIRTITEIREATGDNAQRTLALHGTAEQLGLAGWLVKQLDQPVDASSPTPAELEYKGPAGDDVVRIFYMPRTATVQDFQEIVNMIRTITEIRRVFTYNDGRAMVVRGSPEQMGMAAWMAAELDRTQAGNAGPEEYTVAGNDVVRVLHVKNAKTVQDFQEMANTMRAMAEIRRAFTYNTGRAMAVRGTTEELAMADWLLQQLDQPGPQSRPSEEFRVAGAADDVMRVFYLPAAQTVQAFQQSAAQIRSTLEIRRVFTYNALHALSVRGTESQLALAQHMVEELGNQ